jgi:hypothetical protein
MKRLRTHIIVCITIGAIAGCVSRGSVGQSVPKDFAELQLPSNKYAVGQIVDMSTSPGSIEIIYDSRISRDRTKIANERSTLNEVVEIMGHQVKGLYDILKKIMGLTSDMEKLNISYPSVRTRIAEKVLIYNNIQREFSTNQFLLDMIKKNTMQGKHYDVITDTINAKVEFSIADSSGTTVVIDPAVVEQFSGILGARFLKKVDDKVYNSIEELVIGFHYDRDMIGTLITK